MKYFALGFVTIMVFVLLAGCAKKQPAAPGAQTTPPPAASQGFVPKTPVQQSVLNAVLKAHPDRKVVGMKIPPAGTMRTFVVDTVQSADNKNPLKLNVVYDTAKKTATVKGVAAPAVKPVAKAAKPKK